MGKISSYSTKSKSGSTSVFDDTTRMVVDGSRGTKGVTTEALYKYFTTPDKKSDLTSYHRLLTPEAIEHRNTFRGKNLGNQITKEQRAGIARGTFDDIYVGDYFEIPTVNDTSDASFGWSYKNWAYILDIDYYFAGSTTSYSVHDHQHQHHLILGFLSQLAIKKTAEKDDALMAHMHTNDVYNYFNGAGTTEYNRIVHIASYATYINTVYLLGFIIFNNRVVGNNSCRSAVYDAPNLASYEKNVPDTTTAQAAYRPKNTSLKSHQHICQYFGETDLYGHVAMGPVLTPWNAVQHRINENSNPRQFAAFTLAPWMIAPPYTIDGSSVYTKDLECPALGNKDTYSYYAMQVPPNNGWAGPVTANLGNEEHYFRFYACVTV